MLGHSMTELVDGNNYYGHLIVCCRIILDSRNDICLVDAILGDSICFLLCTVETDPDGIHLADIIVIGNKEFRV